MTVNAYASRSHYLDHIAPVWRALASVGAAGSFFVPHSLMARAALLGLTTTAEDKRLPDMDLALTASFGDMAKARGGVLMEHGAGQSYGGSVPAYAGGAHREKVRLFLCPNEMAAERNRAAYPATPAVVVGCPKLDRWYGHTFTGKEVAISFRFEATVVPEARSALRHYRAGLPALAEHLPLIGHAHPRAVLPQAAYVAAGIDFVPEFDDVMERAACYVVDNSSTGWEFMATDRPVVWMNAPWYRRSKEYGMRFWELAGSGLQASGPEELRFIIAMALRDSPAQRELRREAVRRVYGELDGLAAERAAAAILEVA